ncbi:uncharacterized protein LOC134193100 [Corticium candelabrum]|uniref:uncharacterized protein LOC134193100 n=1 Tax=Corticium candelabrum TaxID=121492 RepID=UPI002E273D54|nr:uncharacterized protein LOC134193100 [Corticium candelabrum]
MSKFLEGLGTNVYHIEFGGFLTNHLMHGVVALFGLGASEAKIKSFTQQYVQQLEPTSHSSSDVQINEETWKSVIGKRRYYPQFVEFFTTRYESLRMSGAYDTPLLILLRQYVPDLVDGGIGCAAFHPIVHIGYGLMMNDFSDVTCQSRDVIDGLAYMTHSYRRPQGCKPSAEVAQSIVEEMSLTTGIQESRYEADLSDVLVSVIKDIRHDTSVKNLMASLNDLISLPSYKSMEPVSTFQQKMAAVGDYGQDFLDKYTIAALKSLHAKFLVDRNLCKQGFPSFVSYSMKAIVDGAVQLYASCSAGDDFFILHGVTSSWALRRTLFCFDSVVVQVQMLISFVKALLSAYVSQDMPAVATKLPEGTKLPEWEEIIKKSVECGDDVDEHVYKLVFTCHEAEKVYGTPPSLLYRRAAAQKMNYLPWPVM